MTGLSLIGWPTNNFKRVATCALSAEIQQACNADDGLFAARLLWSDINGYQVRKQNVTDAVKATRGIHLLDAKGVFDAAQNNSSSALGLTRKMKWNRAGTRRQSRRTCEHNTAPRALFMLPHTQTFSHECGLKGLNGSGCEGEPWLIHCCPCKK